MYVQYVFYLLVGKNMYCTYTEYHWEVHKAVIFLARKQIRKYAEDGCEGFFCSRLFFCVSVLSDFGFVEQ